MHYVYYLLSSLTCSFRGEAISLIIISTNGHSTIHTHALTCSSDALLALAIWFETWESALMKWVEEKSIEYSYYWRITNEIYITKAPTKSFPLFFFFFFLLVVLWRCRHAEVSKQSEYYVEPHYSSLSAINQERVKTVKTNTNVTIKTTRAIMNTYE